MGEGTVDVAGLRAGAEQLALSNASLVPTGERSWRADRHMLFEARAAVAGHGRLDGGELSGHSLRIAEEATGYRCLAVSSVFPREGRVDVPVDYSLELLHTGRTMAFANVDARQGDRVVGFSQLMLAGATDGPSQLGAPVPAVDWSGATDDADMIDMIDPAVAVVGGIPLGDPGAGAPEVHVVLRVPPELGRGQEQRMYLVYALDHVMMAPALRPFDGIGYRTKRAFFTAVTAQSVRFWAGGLPAGELRLSIVSPVVTNGIGITVAHGYDPDGELVLTCTQDLFARAAGH